MYACVYVSYRFRTDEDWQVYSGYDLDYNQTDYLLYTFAHGRYLILNEILTEEGQQIDPDIILNRYEQYPSVTSSAHLNLFGYLDDFLGPQGTRLTKLFPGWKENGQLVSWFYPLTSGRHVLEPAGQVALDDKYTVEIRRYWMDADGQVDPTATTLSYLQTLTYYAGAASTDENGYATVGTLTVPQYVQAVDFPYYPCLSAGYLDLPDSVIYVNTAGVPSIFDDWLSYDHGLQVTQGYTVAEGNPNYSSEDGILYNKDKTEILGVPTNRRELTVPAGVTKVVLPYQTNLSALHLDFTSVDDLPDINYDRLKRSCKLIVPDDQLDAFLEAENAMLKRTNLSVAPASGYDHTYVVRGDFLFDDQGTICRVLRTDTQWLTLPDGATGVSADALRAMEELTVLILPKDGKALPFASGCLDGLTTLTTIACYSQEQLDAVAASAPEGVKVKLVDAVREDGYSYLITEGGILLLAAPEDLVSFDGTIPMGEGEAPLSIAAVGDSVFENHDALRWVTLPEGCKMIGYQAFKGCAKLQGVVINDPDFILIGKDSFDSCADLRYIASNARTCDLRDWDLALPLGQAYNNPNYTLLFCPTENTGYNSNWVSFTEDSDVVAFAQYDCGGTNLLCGISAEGAPWLGLRSGTDIAGTVTLPEGLQYIFSYAFADAYGANDEAFNLDWAASSGTLANIGVYAFANSDLGANVTLSEDITIGSNAFQSCRQLKSITIPGQNIIINDNAFYGCYNLESVTFGGFHYYYSLCSGTFSGCSSLRELNFTSETAPDLAMSFFSPGSKYYFNANSWSSFEEEEAALTIHVPEGCEEDYVTAWRYFMAGYVDLYYMTAYQSMWSTIQDSLTDFENNILPENDAVFAEVDRQLLAAENHIRALLGVAPADHLERPYTYTVDEDGYITLTAVKGLGYADLTAESMDMPYGWALDYIAPGAFSLSPDLQMVNLPDNLAGIYDGAFTGVTTESLTLITMAETPPALLGFETGTPFSFGIDDMYIDLSLISWSDSEKMQAAYVRAWLFPMAGYHDMDEMCAAVAAALEEKNGAAPTDEEVTAAVMTQLLEAENRVRELVGMDIISDTEDMIGLTEPDPEPDWPDLPDWPEWPDETDPEWPEWPDETDPEWPEWPDETDPALPEGGEETETPEEPGETQEPDETGDDQNTPDPDGSDDDASAPADDMTGETEEGQTGPEEEQA